MSKMAYILVVTIVVVLLQLILPWWIIMVVMAIACAITDYSRIFKLLCSFLIPFMIWLLWSIIVDGKAFKSPADAISDIIGLPGAWASFLITGLVAGLAGLAGYFVGVSLRRLALQSAGTTAVTDKV